MSTLGILLALFLFLGINDAFSFSSKPTLMGQPVVSSITRTKPQPHSRRRIVLYSASPDSTGIGAHNASATSLSSSSNYAKSYLKSLQAEPVPHGDAITRADKAVLGGAGTAMILGFIALFRYMGPGGWRYFLAGGVCAATSHAMATPIDVVKTRIQVDPNLVNKSFVQAAMRIYEKEGFRGLLSGLGPTTFGYLLEGALKFGIYEILKPAAGRGLARLAAVTSMPWLQSQFLSFAVCGAVSGTAASVVLCPMEAIRIRLVAEPDFCTGGWVKGGYKMLKSEGSSALTKGLTPMLYKQVPYTISKNVAFDFLTRGSYSMMRTGGMAVTTSTKIMIPFVCALTTSILATICSQPGDMLLSLVNAHEGTKRTNDFAKDILKGEWGLKGFFVGTSSRLLHVGIIVTSQLLLYDVIKRMVGIAATGSV